MLGNEEIVKTLFTFQNVAIGDKKNRFNFGNEVVVDSAYKLLPNERLENVPSKLDLSVQIGHDFDGELRLEIEYRTDLYSRERVLELYRNFSFIIDQFLEEDNLKVAALVFPKTYYDEEIIDETVSLPNALSIPDFLFKQIASHDQNQVALLNSSSNEEVTYGELVRNANKIAGAINAQLIENKTKK